MMKRLFFLSFFLTNTFALADYKTHQGSYEVPREDGAIVDFPSTVKFQGNSLSEAEEFEVTFPVQLTGVKNKFKIKKIENHWEGDPELFEEVTCSKDQLVYDFSCRLKFKKDRVFDITDQDQNAIQPLIPSLPALQIAKDFENTDPTSLLIDRNLAVELMESASLSASAIQQKTQSIDIFLSEPIGFFKYRSSGGY